MAELNIAQKVQLNKQVYWKNGELFVWTVPGIIIPTYTFIEIIHAFEQKIKDAHGILYAIGEKQTLIATEYMMQKFGFKTKIDIINSVLQQSALLGYGEFKIVNINLKEGLAIFRCNNTPFAKYYKTLYGIQKNPVDAYMAGTLAGMIKVITGKDIFCIETKCIAKGDSYCLFEAKPLDKCDKKILAQQKIDYEHLNKIRKIISKPH